MSFDAESLGKEMVAAAREVIAGRWPVLRAVAEGELRRLAASVVDVAVLLQDGAIDTERARHLLHIHQITTRSVLTTVEGLGLLTAEQATRAAIRAISPVINAAVGIKLLEGSTHDFKAGKDL